jgi:DNA-binding NarL/FixJ family response regulator
MLRVLIADDHAIVRKGLREILRDRPDPTEVGEAADGPAVLEQMRATDWDLVVLDITMPGLNGLEVLRRLRRQYPRVPVLMLSMHSSAMYVAQSLKAGASGYLSKETAPEELVNAIDAALAGRTYVSRALRASVQQSLPEVKH